MNTEFDFDPFEAVVLFPEIGQPTWVELIVATYRAPRTHLHRDLADPSVYANVRDLALVHGIRPISGFTAYLRKLPADTIDIIDWLTPLQTGMSIVVVPESMPPDGVTRVQQALAGLPEILPTRMIWPV